MQGYEWRGRVAGCKVLSVGGALRDCVVAIGRVGGGGEEGTGGGREERRRGKGEGRENEGGVVRVGPLILTRTASA